MEKKKFFAVLAVYFAVACLILASNVVSMEAIGGIGVVPGFLSLLLLIPLWIWHSRRGRGSRVDLQQQHVQDGSKRSIVFWALTLFFLALVVRIPSVLLFGAPYEKTPLVYLVVLFIVVLMRGKLFSFGFQTAHFSRALLAGAIYYILLGLSPLILMGAAFYVLEGKLLISGFNPLVFLFTMPFMTLCVGISEEGLFRGYMQTRLSRVYSRRKAVFFQALLFGIWHFIWHVAPLDWFGMINHVGNTFVWGLLVGYFYMVTSNLTPIVLAHGLTNSVLEGLVQNQSALTAFQNLPPAAQLFLYVVPYAATWIVTFGSTKLLANKLLARLN